MEQRGNWWLGLAGLLGVGSILSFLASGPGMDGLGWLMFVMAFAVVLVRKPRWWDED